jgi:predicted membrane protein
MEQKGFLRLLISATSQESSKRFVVIVSIIVFLALFIVCIFLMILLMIKVLPGSTNALVVTRFFNLFDNVTYYAFFIICFGIGAVLITGTTSLLSQIFTKKAEAEVITAQKGAPDVVVQKQEVQNQNIGTVAKE